MKKFSFALCVFLAMTALFSVCAFAASVTTPSSAPKEESAPRPLNPLIRLSTTTSVNDSGLMSALRKEFEWDTGYKLEILSNGSGAAIKLGERGDADVLLVHEKASGEELSRTALALSASRSCTIPS